MTTNMCLIHVGMDEVSQMKRQLYAAGKKFKPRWASKTIPFREIKLKEPFRRHLISKTIKVYKGGRRHYITKSGAARGEARAIIKSQCSCYSPHDYSETYYRCHFHSMDYDKQRLLIDRLARTLLGLWRRNEIK